MNEYQAYNLNAEESLIGSLFKIDSGSQFLASALAMLSTDDFYRKDHQQVFSNVKTKFLSGEAFDLVLIAERLEAETGEEWFVRIGTIIRNTASASNINGYARIIKEKSLERATLAKLNDSIQVITGDGTTEDKISQITGLLTTIENESRVGSGGLTHIKDIALKWFDIYDDRINNPDAAGIKTGISGLDDLFGNRGVGKTDMIVIGARPKMGKTQLAITIADSISTTTQKPVMIFSMEMSNEQVFERMLSSSSRVSSDNFYQPMGNAEMDDITVAIAKMAQSQIYIDDHTNMSLAYIRGECRKMKAKNGDLGAVFIDYLTLMQAEKADRNDLAVAAITKGLKNMAKDLKVPVFLLAQLNRGLESRPDKRPIMSDLRETGQIEQDADRIIMIYRESVYDTDSPLGGLTELIVRANRHGATGTAFVDMKNGIMENIDTNQMAMVNAQVTQAEESKSKKGKLDW